jgi:hypothetical protein
MFILQIDNILKLHSFILTELFYIVFKSAVVESKIALTGNIFLVQKQNI